MEENNSQTPTKKNSNSDKKDTNNSIPAVKSLFTESYYLLKKVFVPYLVFNVLVFIATGVAVVMTGSGLFLLGIALGFSGIFTGELPAIVFGALGGFTFLFIVVGIIFSIGQIGSIIILNDENPKISVFSALKRSFKYVIPIILVGIVTGFFIFGGSILLIIPGIIFSLLLAFAYFSIIIEGKGPISGIKRSVSLVKNNFAAFFVRILALWGALILVGFALEIILSFMPEEASISIVFYLIYIILQILMGWFATTYMVLLFKHFKKADPAGESSLKWITIVSIIGWVLAILLVFLVIRALPEFISNLQEEVNQNQQQNMAPQDEEELDRIMESIEEDFDTDDIENSIEESTDSPEMDTETSTPPAQTF